MTGIHLAGETDGRFLCVRVTNHGPAATITGIVQPGRGTASAAIPRTALWHDGFEAERRLETGQSALLRVAQRDRPPTAAEDDDRRRAHPEGPQAWRLCFLKKGVGASLERICPVVRREESTEHDGVAVTLMTDASQRPIVKSLSLEGEVAIDPDTGEQFRVLDSPRHYFVRPR